MSFFFFFALYEGGHKKKTANGNPQDGSLQPPNLPGTLSWIAQPVKTPRNAFLFFMGYQSPTVCYSSLDGLRHTCTDVQKDTQDCGKCLGEKYNRAK